MKLTDTLESFYTTTIDVIVEEMPPENKGPPTFKDELKEIILIPNEVISYTLPEIVDPDNDKFILKSI